MGRPVVAADASIGMVDGLARCLPRATVCCDIRRLPFRPASFAGLIVSGVLLHLPKESCQSALEEVGRVLIPAGRALVSMKRGTGEGWRTLPPFPHRRWYALYQPEEFLCLCGRAGLTASMTGFPARGDWFSLTVSRPN